MKAIGSLRVAAPLVAVLSWGGAACSLAPPPDTPATVTAMPASYRVVDEPSGRDPVRWWRTFDDPVLDELIEAALSANLDLREAAARLEELRHRYRIASAPLFPAIDLRADASRSSTPGNTGLGGAFGGDEEGGAAPPDTTGGPAFRLPERFEFTTYSASLGFSYEVDFWGRLRNESGAAVREFLASRADLETVRLAVIGSTIATYLEIVALRRQLALAEENVDLLGERAEITEARYRTGLTGSFELYAIRQQFRNAQAELPGLRTRLVDAEGRLAVVLGTYAGELDAAIGAEPRPSVEGGPVPAGLPVALLEERPDVLSASQRVEAARLRVGARRAEQLPTITLNGSAGFQSSEPENLFRADQWFLNLVGGLFAPLFQGGRLRANVGVAEAQYEQVLVAYLRTVLQAFQEVRTSLFAFDNERERYARVRDQLEEARASLDYQLRRFERGVGDYVSYLDARRNLLGAQTTMVLAERSLGEARLGVHRALGGAWVDETETLDGSGSGRPGSR